MTNDLTYNEAVAERAVAELVGADPAGEQPAPEDPTAPTSEFEVVTVPDEVFIGMGDLADGTIEIAGEVFPQTPDREFPDPETAQHPTPYAGERGDEPKPLPAGKQMPGDFYS